MMCQIACMRPEGINTEVNHRFEIRCCENKVNSYGPIFQSLRIISSGIDIDRS